MLRSGGISNAADPWGDVMKFIVEVDFPLEPFSTYVRQGTAGEKIGEMLGASQVPHVTEPLILNFGASVHYRVAMAPEELQAAGLERYATT